MLKWCDCAKVLIWFCAGVFAVLALYKGWYWLAHHIMAEAPGTKLPEALEASGALFSGLAFFAALGTLWVQRKDLELQRVEMQKTREEMEGQKEQLALQHEAIQTQSFENTFFNLLNMYASLVSGLKCYDRMENSEVAGRNVFSLIMKYCDGTKRGYQGTYNQFSDTLAPYFMSVYWVIRYVHESDMAHEKRKKYTSIMRTQFSRSELELLMYNCVFGHGVDKFKPLVEEYALLEHLNWRSCPQEVPTVFSSSAFGLTSWPETEATPPA